MPFILANWKLLVLGSLILILGIQTWRLDRCQKSFHDFEVSVEAIGRAQKAKVEADKKANEALTKEVTDAKDKAISNLSSRYARARLLNRPGGGGMSSPTEAPSLVSACEPADGLVKRLGELEAALLDALEKADREMVKYRALWKWANERP